MARSHPGDFRAASDVVGTLVGSAMRVVQNLSVTRGD
ncbi:hypothetical protein QF038_002235 [Pseudarthrobacter sp. W1I19]|nr:hypothetical protein [Pseudarthrobacter sp. W1I19]